MFGGLGMQAFEFETHNFTYNSHHFAVDPKLFKTDHDLSLFWTVTSTSTVPNNGTEFVASIEAKDEKYPFYATQFHPEKPSQLWVDGYDINHSWQSVMANQSH